MYEIDGICYAGTRSEDVRIVEAIPLVGGMLLVTFLSGERRLFDTTTVTGSAFAPLRDGTAQATVRVEHGSSLGSTGRSTSRRSTSTSTRSHMTTHLPR